MFSFLAYINDTAIATKYKQSEHTRKESLVTGYARLQFSSVRL